jgi:hypothetical protein
MVVQCDEIEIAPQIIVSDIPAGPSNNEEQWTITVMGWYRIGSRLKKVFY